MIVFLLVFFFVFMIAFYVQYRSNLGSLRKDLKILCEWLDVEIKDINVNSRVVIKLHEKN